MKPVPVPDLSGNVTECRVELLDGLGREQKVKLLERRQKNKIPSTGYLPTYQGRDQEQVHSKSGHQCKMTVTGRGFHAPRAAVAATPDLVVLARFWMG